MGALAERPVDHAGLSVLTYDDCQRLLRSQPVGRVAFHRGGEVEVFPVTYVVDHTLVAFRTAYGSKLGAAVENAVVTFEVDGFDATSRTGWSVVVKGRATTDIDEATHGRLEASGLHPWTEAAASGQWVVIWPTEVTGRGVGPAGPPPSTDPVENAEP